MLRNHHLNWLKCTGAAALAMLLSGCSESLTGVLNPKGIVAFQERQLLFDSLFLMLIVVIPVIIMSFEFLYRYRESMHQSEYKPEWCHSVTLEAIWWGVPMAIILVMAIMTWTMTHRLDPYNPVAGQKQEPLQVSVVALPWKWLFIYPEQNIATVNYLRLPVNRAVEFHLTSDNVPMSAFFIPQLGSQIYTMAGMRTKLNLLATHKGTFEGLNSQYNGDGFSDMTFKVDVVEEKDMKSWFAKTKAAGKRLNAARYKQVRQKSIKHKPETFAGVEKDLFATILKSYQSPTHPA